jgi:dTDP-L-rhamnose 4-epimerase
MTGGAGFIGTAVARGLIETGPPPLALDSMHPQVHSRRGRPPLLPEAVELRNFDVTRPDRWDALLDHERPSTIIDLAAETGTGQSLTEATRHGMVSVVGTTQLLGVLTRSGQVPEHLILSSSRAVYGEGAWEEDGVVV